MSVDLLYIKLNFIAALNELIQDQIKINNKRFDHRIKRHTDNFSKELGIQNYWLI